MAFIFISKTRKGASRLWNKLKWCIPMIGYPTQKKEGYRPFFIIGSGRSGTTLLRRILNENNEVYIPPESILGEVIGLYKRYNKMSWPHLVRLIYATFEYHPEFYTFKIATLSDLSRKVSEFPKQKRTLANILNSLYEHYRDVHAVSGKRWGDKTPFNTFYLGEIMEVFPDAKFIHMIRDPYDSIMSNVKKGRYDSYYDAAVRWRDAVEISTEFGEKHPSSYYELEYEKLVTDPEYYTKEICRFLEIEYVASMFEIGEESDKLGDVQLLQHHANVLKPITDENIGKARNKLSAEDISIINSVLKTSKNETVTRYIHAAD